LIIKKAELESAVKKIKKAENKKGFQGLLRIATSYKVWQQNPEFFSLSRSFHLILFLVGFAGVFQNMALIAVILIMPECIINKNKYLIYLVICELGALLWIPFQDYSIENTRELLLSSAFKFPFGGLNIINFSMYYIEIATTIFSILKNATKQYKPVLLVILLAGSCLRFPVVSYSSVIDKIFGINSLNPLVPWFSFILFSVPVFSLLLYSIDSYVRDE
jgi:hypothetical protein